MKKLMIVIIILTLIPLTMASAEDNSADLGMSMKDFIQKYNSIQAPLGSPYVQLNMNNAEKWVYFNGYWCACFYPENTHKIVMFLMTKDKSRKRDLNLGLDIIQLYAESDEDLIALICLAMRVTTIFTTDLFGLSMSGFYVADVIKFFYENEVKEKKIYTYRQLDTETDYTLSMFYSYGYYFQISPLEVVK